MLKKCLPVCVVVAVHAAMIAPAIGQEVGTQTTPEVRDFRLDTPPPRTESATAPAPAQPAPSAPATAAPTPQTPVTANPRIVETSPRRPQQPVRSSPTAEASAEPEQQQIPSQERATTPADAPTAEVDQPVIPDTAPAAPASTAASDESIWVKIQSYWPWLAAALLLLLAGLAFALKRRAQSDANSFAAVENESWTDAEPSAKPSIAPPLAQPSLSATFTPETANLSLANLTVTGKLTIRNMGSNPVNQLKIRTAMMSAMDNQNARIAEFHSDPAKGHSEAIGDASAGEEIALALEIQIPRAELNTFDWRERQFLAPIILAHVSGFDADGKPDECQLSCLVGRESQPPSSKMKPLHVDRGPRRFGNLGFRTVSV